MNKTEQKVLETLKNGFGLTSAEQEILANYIDKLQKQNKELSRSNFQFLEINQKLIEENPIIKELTEKELNLLEKIDKLEKQNREYEYTIAGMVQTREDYFIPKYKIKDKIKKLEEEQKKEIEETNMSLLSVPIRILKELLGE